MCYRTKGLAKMLQFCATQHFGENKKKQKLKTKQDSLHALVSMETQV